MGVIQSKTNRRRWRKVPKATRSEMMRKLVLKRHSKLSKKERIKIGRTLTAARLKKQAGRAP